MMKQLFNTGIKLFPLLIAACISLAAVTSRHDGAPGGVKPVLKNGSWRSVLQRPDGRQIVFNFDITEKAGRKQLYLLNAGERMLVDSIRLVNDSVFIQLPFFESRFRAKINPAGNLEGQWIKRLADHDQVMPLVAFHDQPQRFAGTQPAKYNVTGRWAVRFAGPDNKFTESVGVFRQKASKVTGSFLTASGDYRYLEGIVTGDSMKLSGFDGGNAYLFTARITGNQLITGDFFSGPGGTKTWTATKDSSAALPDGYGETTMRTGESKLNFSFNSINDETVSITDDRFRGKAVVVQIMGSWCPNCMDETSFLSAYYNANRQKGVEMIALAYERTTDLERSKKSLQSFQRRFDVKYPVLITGVTVNDSLRTEKTLPQLTTIKAFPTTLFIDKKGVVRKIYTGFTGPGTGEYYEQYKKEFAAIMTEMLSENP